MVSQFSKHTMKQWKQFMMCKSFGWNLQSPLHELQNPVPLLLLLLLLPLLLLPLPPNPPSPHPPPLRVFEQRKGASPKAYFCIAFFTAAAASSPEVTSCPSSHLRVQLLTILRHKLSLWWTRHHPSPTTYVISLL